MGHHLHTNRSGEEPDYTEPLDAVGEKTEATVYINPKEEHQKRDWKSDENVYETNLFSIRKQRFSDSNLQYEHNKEPAETSCISEVKVKRSILQKKQSIPIFLRKLSAKQKPS